MDKKKERLRIYLHFMGKGDDIKFPKCVCEKADIEFEEEFLFEWNDENLYMKRIPGHTVGSILIQLNDQYVFTGDSLMKTKEIITKISGGDIVTYMKSARPYLQSLDSKLTVMPGHGEAFQLAEKVWGEV